jgi:hypothetical protein
MLLSEEERQMLLNIVTIARDLDCNELNVHTVHHSSVTNETPSIVQELYELFEKH